MTQRFTIGCATLGALLFLGAQTVHAERITPATVEPLIPSGYEAQDEDERGLWQAFDELERQLSESNLLERDPDLNAYVRSVTDRLAGSYAGDIRLYIVRDASFNASMAPNGMMLVHTGLLARMRNEAQLAAVLGHELGHYLRRHSISRWRNIKTKTAVMAIVSIGGNAATSAGSGVDWGYIANGVNASLIASIMSYSRKHETEADAFGLKLIANAGYRPESASEIWQQVVEERKASAKARDKRYRDASRSLLSSHPPSESRQAELQKWAKKISFYADPNTVVVDGADEWREAMQPVRFSLLDEQIKLNNPGASLYLIEMLARAGWTSDLRFFEGEAYNMRGFDGDAQLAEEAYAKAVDLPGVSAEAWRAYGYARQKAGDKMAAREALKRYLDMKPDAPDAAMVRFSIGPD